MLMSRWRNTQTLHMHSWEILSIQVLQTHFFGQRRTSSSISVLLAQIHVSELTYEFSVETDVITRMTAVVCELLQWQVWGGVLLWRRSGQCANAGWSAGCGINHRRSVQTATIIHAATAAACHRWRCCRKLFTVHTFDRLWVGFQLYARVLSHPGLLKFKLVTLLLLSTGVRCAVRVHCSAYVSAVPFITAQNADC